MFFIGFEVEEKAIKEIKIMVFFNTSFSNTHSTGTYISFTYALMRDYIVLG